MVIIYWYGHNYNDIDEEMIIEKTSGILVVYQA